MRRRILLSALVLALAAIVIARASSDPAEAIPPEVNLNGPRIVATAAPELTSASIPEPTPEPTPAPDPDEVELIGRTIWGEAGGIPDEAERAAVAWCILNRADAWGQSIEQVVTAPQQFHGYLTRGTCPQEHLELAADVLSRWYAEKAGAGNVGRTLPAEYLFFVGDGAHNHYSAVWQSGIYYDWSLPSPYVN